MASAWSLERPISPSSPLSSAAPGVGTGCGARGDEAGGSIMAAALESRTGLL
jgi:hypothetical protein